MVWKKEIFKRIIILCLAGLLNLLLVITASAAEPGQILSYAVDGNQVILYLQDPGSFESVSLQSGTVKAENVSAVPISEEQVSVRTLCLVDNSLSILEKYRPVIKEILNGIAANRMPGEQITIATFDEDIRWLINDSSDYASLKKTIDGITFVNQDTCLVDVLYSVFNVWKKDGDTAFRRILIISDGVNDKDIGYTKDELNSLIKNDPCPVYTIGCRHKKNDNNAMLENMFSISRLTYASAWLLDDIQDPIEAVQEFAKSNNTLKVTALLPSKVEDGTEKGVLVSFDGDPARSSRAVVRMPFAEVKESESAAETEAEITTAAAPETESETASETEPETKPEPEKSGIGALFKKYKLYILGGGAALIGILILMIVMLGRKKEEDSLNEFVRPPENVPSDFKGKASGKGETPSSGGKSQGENRKTASATGDEKNLREDNTELILPPGSERDDTALIYGGTTESGRHRLILTDISNPARRYETPLSGMVIVGRNPEVSRICIEDRAVGKKHCAFVERNGVLRIKDLDSKNGTIVNGVRVAGDQEVIVANGSILNIGRTSLKVEMR